MFFLVALVSLVELFLLLLRSIVKDDKIMIVIKATALTALSWLIIAASLLVSFMVKGEIWGIEMSILALWVALIPAILCEFYIARFIRKKSALQFAIGK